VNFVAKGTVQARAQRLAQVAEFIAQGWSTRAIAAKTGVSRKRAWEDVQAVLADLPQVDVTEQRAAMVERLEGLRDRLTELLDDQHENGSESGEIERTAAQVLRVEERLAKLLGLDAPVKAEVQHSNIQISVTNADGV
jgi:hypothetical protein